MRTGGFLLYEGLDTFELYNPTESGRVFRTIIKRDDNALAFLTGLGGFIRILKPLREVDNSPILLRIERQLTDIQTRLRIKQ